MDMPYQLLTSLTETATAHTPIHTPTDPMSRFTTVSGATITGTTDGIMILTTAALTTVHTTVPTTIVHITVATTMTATITTRIDQDSLSILDTNSLSEKEIDFRHPREGGGSGRA